MGGHYSARSGLADDVDLAVDWGGPVEVAFYAEPSHFGMAGSPATPWGSPLRRLRRWSWSA
jgi:esterase FrsA